MLLSLPSLPLTFLAFSPLAFVFGCGDQDSRSAVAQIRFRKERSFPEFRRRRANQKCVVPLPFSLIPLFRLIDQMTAIVMEGKCRQCSHFHGNVFPSSAPGANGCRAVLLCKQTVEPLLLAMKPAGLFLCECNFEIITVNHRSRGGTV